MEKYIFPVIGKEHTARPKISNDFDSDQAQAVTTCRNLFERVVWEGWLVAGDHHPFPGFGYLRKEVQPNDYARIAAIR